MGPYEELQRLIIGTLLADPAVSGYVGVRVYDKPKQNVIFPYIRLAQSDQVPRDADCIAMDDLVRQVDVYTRDPEQSLICGQISEAVQEALHDQPLALTDNALANIVASYRVIGDPDGITDHGVVTVTATIQQP